MGNRIKELREQRGLTQQQLADMIGTTKQQIGRLEGAKRRLSDQWVQKIAGALEVHPGELWAEVPAGEQLSPQEEAMLNLFRGLSEEQRQAWLKAFTAMAQPARDDDGENGGQQANGG